MPGYACTVIPGLYEVDGGGDGARRGHRAGAPRGVRGDRGRRADPRAVRPRRRPPDGADPVAAAGLRGAPPPGAHQGAAAGRAGRGDRRRARGAPRRAAAGLRRRGGQPVPGVRDDREPDPARHARPASSRARRSATTSTALVKGVLKIMSKMGISTVGAYTAAQVFEAFGLASDVLDEYFTGTSSKLGGVGLDVIAGEVAARHHRAHPENPTDRVHRRLESGGEYAYRREGELHLFTPETVFLLQHATKTRPRGRVPRVRRRGRAAQPRGRRAARAVQAPHRGPRAGAAGRGRAGRGDPQALQHRRDVLRLDQRRGARDAGHRDEPDRRAVQHRRGRRGHRPALRPGAALGDQADRERPVRRHQRVPGQRDRPADQDGAGREAGRGRPAAAEQGVAVDRAHPALDRRASA